MHFVPSMLQVFLEQPEVEAAARALRQVICSGEALRVELVQARCLEQVRSAELHQSVWADGGGGRRDVWTLHCRAQRANGADRPADCEHADLHAG